MRYIGDIHGSIDEYLALIEGVNESIQVGDFGYGFFNAEEIDPMIPQGHKFIRGNHDSLQEAKKSPNFVSDGTYENGRFFLGGAFSIDFEWRQRYESSTGIKIWWEDEECSMEKLQEIVDLYETVEPEIVVTHDCPRVIAEQLHSHHMDDKSRTRQAMDVMFTIHKPTIWIFGHHHVSFDKVVNGTRFIALAELEFIDL